MATPTTQLTDSFGNPLNVGGDVTITRQLTSGVPTAKINGVQLYAPAGGGGGGASASVPFGKRGIGCAKYQPIVEGAINHIVEYGQSLSVGGDSVAITTNDVADCYMLGTNPRDVESTTFSALHNNNGQDVGEQINNGEDEIVATVHALKYLCLQNRVDTEFLGTSSGAGGMIIDKLSKTPQSISWASYYNRFLSHINHAKTAATAANKQIVCPAIMFIHGETDYETTQEYSAGTYVLEDDGTHTDEERYRPAIDYYKRLLVQLKNDMQADIMTTYNQSLKPLFYVQAPGTTAHNVKGCWVNMAMIEACEENDDMILVGASNYAPRPNVHLSGNGYRWCAERMAKVIYQTNFFNYKFEPIYPIAFSANGNQIIITHKVPCPPLTIDTHTVQAIIRSEIFTAGYQIAASNGATLQSVSVNGCDVILTMSKAVSGSVSIRYASGNNAYEDKGRGNICDSDRWETLYPYIDDLENPYAVSELNYRPLDEDGNYIFGQKYPMQNWCVPYCVFLNF